MYLTGDDNNIAHLRLQRVGPHEIEELFGNDPLVLEYDIEAGEERYKSLGATVPRTSPNRCLDGKEWKHAARDGVRGT